jgi:hypothetical protein
MEGKAGELGTINGYDPCCGCFGKRQKLLKKRGIRIFQILKLGGIRKFLVSNTQIGRQSFWRKKGNKKILIFKYSNWEAERGIRKF